MVIYGGTIHPWVTMVLVFVQTVAVAVACVVSVFGTIGAFQSWVGQKVTFRKFNPAIENSSSLNARKHDKIPLLRYVINFFSSVQRFKTDNGQKVRHFRNIVCRQF